MQHMFMHQLLVVAFTRFHWLCDDIQVVAIGQAQLIYL